MIRKTISLAIFVPGFIVLGAFSTLDSGLSLWWGVTVGAALGVLFGLGFGGNAGGRLWDKLSGRKMTTGTGPDYAPRRNLLGACVVACARREYPQRPRTGTGRG